MYDIFNTIVQFNIQACFLVLAVVILRLLLRKAPRSLICALWTLVAVRLIFPFRIESIFSLVPKTRDITLSVSHYTTEAVKQVFPEIDSTPLMTAGGIQSNDSIGSGDVVGAHLYYIASFIWMIGVGIMLIYALISYIRLYRLTRENIATEDGAYLCDRIPSPFILGIVRPKIFLPSNIGEHDKPYVLAHEKAHIKRRDHLWKPLGFLLLSVYWFNPLLWVAYVLLCKDIELACDEKVIKELGFEVKKPYAIALINSAAPRKLISACPLAFGETSVKSRIKNVLNYKKPAFWIIIVAVVLSIAVAVCFLTNPPRSNQTDILLPDIDQISTPDSLDGKNIFISDTTLEKNEATATPDITADPVSAQYIWSSYEESTSPQDGYGYINLRISNYSDQYIAVDMSNFRVYKDGKPLTPAYTNDTQYYGFYKAGTSNTTMVSLYPYLDEHDTTSTFRLEMDYYSFEETDASDIDGEYAPNVGKDLLGSIAVDFNFLSKEERGDVPDFLDDILYHDIDGDGKDEMLVLYPDPPSDNCLSVGAYDKDTHKVKYSAPLTVLDVTLKNNIHLTVIGNDAVLQYNEINFSNLDESRQISCAIRTNGKRLYLKELNADTPEIDLTDIDDLNVSIDIPYLAYLNQNLAIFGGDCGMVIYDLAEQKITDRLSIDTLNRIGYAVPYVDVTADGREVYIFDYGDEPNGNQKYTVYSPETHDINAYMSKFDFQMTSINWFEFSKTQYDVRYDNALGNVSARIYQIGDYQYEVSAPGWKIKNLQLTVKKPDGTEKTYRIFE